MTTNAFRPRVDATPSPWLSGRLSDRALWLWLAGAALAALFVCERIATQSLILGSPGGHWVYGYIEAFSTRPLLVSLLAGALAASLLAVLDPGSDRHDWPALLAWLCLATALQALIRSVTPFTFERVFSSDVANAFYSVTRQVRASAVLSDFDRLRASWPEHAQSNMPGKLMLVYALRTLSRNPGRLAWLTVAVSNTGAVFMYLFVRELFMDRRTAMYAAVLYLLTPAKLYFFPLLNTATPVIAIACAWLVLRWLRTGRATDAGALGIALFGLAFYEPLPLVMGLLFALFVLRAVWLGEISWRRVLAHTVVGVLAWLAVYGIVRRFLGFDLVSAFRQLSVQATQFNRDVERPYSIWVLANLREFFFGVGVCQSIALCAALVDGRQRGDTWRDYLTRPITVLCIGVMMVLVATDAIGVNRGEVIRLWIFLACFFQIPTAYLCARLNTRAALLLVIAVTLVQAALGTAMIGFVVPG